MTTSKYFLLVFGLLYFEVSRAQMGLPTVIPPSPEAAALSKYADVPVSLYTGTPNIEIPIYNLECRGLSLPIYLSYYASGIKVEDGPSWCGAGWSLNAGGVVTRTIRDKPNDTRPNQGLPIREYGHTTDDFYTVNNIALGTIDKEGDVFYYNFRGHTGVFYFNQNGTVLKKYDDIKIEWILDAGGAIITEFIITTRDGTKHFFERSDYQTEWLLKRITDANQVNSIFFEYERGNSYILPSRNSNYYYFVSTDPTPQPLSGLTPSFHSTKPLGHYLKKIYTSNYDSIVFVTKELEFDEPPPAPSSVENHHKALDLIHVYNFRGQKVKSFKFHTKNIKTIRPYSLHVRGYPPVGTTYSCNYRVYLDGISEISPDMPSIDHVFEYYGRTANGMDSLPSTFSFAQDFGGYYNGKDNNPSLVPTFDDFLNPGHNTSNNRCINPWLPTERIHIPGADRSTSFTYMRMGTLKSIQYPTAGKVRFYFSQQINPYGSEPYWAIKIDKIEYLDADGNLLKRKRYEYSNATLGHNIPSHIGYMYYQDGPSGWSVSTVPYCPCSQVGPCDEEGSWYPTLELSPGPKEDLGLFDGPMIGYGTVKEFEEGNGYTLYEFSNEDGYQELDHFKVESIAYGQIGWDPPEFGVVYGLVPYGDNYAWPLGPFPSSSWKRGVLLSQSTYSESNTLLSKISYDYSFIELEKIPSIKTLIQKRDFHYHYYQYDQIAFWVRLNSVTSVTDGVTSTTLFQYNSSHHKQKSNESTTRSDGSVKTVEYKYPHDFIPSQPYNTMVQQYVIAPVVEQVEKKDGNTIQVIKSNYGFFQNNAIIAPSSIQQQIGSHPIDTRIHYHAYDAKGNLLSVSKEDDVKTCYIWGYKNAYPVAKIVGADYNTAFAALAPADVAALENPSSNQQVRDIIQTIRSHPSMSGATVYTYTYDPLVGMTSMTDQNNYTTFYEYDSLGRLAYIKDSDSNIVKKYEYNYKAR